jgi:hypothetical protein
MNLPSIDVLAGVRPAAATLRAPPVLSSRIV